MKILHVITSLNRGGAENHLRRLALIQAKKNDVSIVYFKGNGYWKNSLKINNVKCEKFTIKNNFHIISIFSSFFRLLNLLKKHKPEIVHAHLAIPEIFVLLVKIFYKEKFKFIVTKHLDSLIFEGSYGQNKIISGKIIEKLIFNYSDKVIFISKNVEKYFRKLFDINKKKTKVIYYGVDRICFQKQKKNNNLAKFLNNYKKEFIILNIARHIPQKRIDLLILGFSEFLKINRDSKLLLVGSGPDTQKLQKLANELKISKNIFWIRYTEDIEALFKVSNIFCLTSEYEGLGLVLLEALFFKKPILTVDRSAMGEILKNKFNGILLKNNFGPKKLASHLYKIKKNKNLSKILIKNGTKTIEKKFNVQKMNKLTLKLYLE